MSAATRGTSAVVIRLALLERGCGADRAGGERAHLGQPLRAWRIFLGWRKSWLSREAMVFGAWLPLTCDGHCSNRRCCLRAAVADCDRTACSAMIYIDTRRRFWRCDADGSAIFRHRAALGAASAFSLGHRASRARRARGCNACEARLRAGSCARLVRWEAESLRNRTRSTPRRFWLVRCAWYLAPGRCFARGWRSSCLRRSSASVTAGCACALVSRRCCSPNPRNAICFSAAVDAPKMPGMPGALMTHMTI